MTARKRIVSLLLGAAVLALGACSSDNSVPADRSGAPAASALPPAYLQVEGFQQCLKSKQVGTYTRWCMPASKPDHCPSQSWDQLNRMQGHDKVGSCQGSSD